MPYPKSSRAAPGATRTLRRPGIAGACALFALCAALLLPTLAQAGGTSVSPIRLDLSAAKRVVTLTVQNSEPVDKVVQARVLRWSQVNGEDHFEPAQDVLVTPALFRLQASSAQTVRVGFVSGSAPPTASEQSWRVFVEEVPNNTPGALPPNELQMTVRHSVPLFYAPKGSPSEAPADALSWRIAKAQDGSLRLYARNPAPVHARLLNLRVRGPAVAEAEAEAQVLGRLVYLLPDVEASWPLAAAAAATPAAQWNVLAQSDDGKLDVRLTALP